VDVVTRLLLLRRVTRAAPARRSARAQAPAVAPVVITSSTNRTLLPRTASAARTAVVATRVWFRRLSRAETDSYLASGEPFDKAGAYAIQGLVSKFVERIDGCYANVAGPAGRACIFPLDFRRPRAIVSSLDISDAD